MIHHQIRSLFKDKTSVASRENTQKLFQRQFDYLTFVHTWWLADADYSGLDL